MAPPSREAGFTMIELLTVVLIIGLLAAMAIPTFLNQRGKAQDTDAKIATRSAQTAIETRYVDNQSYVSTVADLIEVESSLAEAPSLAVFATNGSYRVTVTSRTGNSFSIERIGPPSFATTERTCVRVTIHGGCPASLSW